MTDFASHASKSDANGAYMNIDDFVEAIAPQSEDYKKINRNSYAVLFEVADRKKTGKVSEADWNAFVSLLGQPDAEYQIAFKLFDTQRQGAVNFDDFVKTYDEHKSKDALPFDWSSKWVSLYAGKPDNRTPMSYPMFSQMLSGLLGERVRQAFGHYDPKGTGFIDRLQFEEIIRKAASHKLSDKLLNNLHVVCDTKVNGADTNKISYAQVRALLNVIRHADLIDKLTVLATQNSPDGQVDRTQFMDAASKNTKGSLLSPLEVDILFKLSSLGDSPSLSGEKISVESFKQAFDPLWLSPEVRYAKSIGKKVDAAKNALSSPTPSSEKSTVVYPIDLVKTRMQNQRASTPGQQLLYKNSWDCFKKVIAREGPRGLYSGLGPQLVGVAPEKAIKLTVNDLVRGKAADKNGNITLPWEIIAGGTAGACQVVFTNPLEIVKIRLQIQGEVAKHTDAPKRSAIWIVRNLGLVGLYKGATACLLRDVPFSAIYFPTYAHLKKDYFGEGPNHKLAIWQLLVAGAVAGMPAAYLTTPCDVIKTRLQVEARSGETSYTGLRHAFSTILREEGPAAFFKGGAARVLRSSPQFGCTLAAYEMLHNLLPLPGHGASSEAGHKVPSSSDIPQSPVHHIRSRNALKILLDIDENFGKPGTLTPERAALIPGLKKN
ncbi:Calcium-binding mitochondrial carrier protein [Yarrowia sp. C11]|nr:Calcium-binding mitochondrial carrier protein [Yarrowia sp. C11]